jgi:hypothetical protein
MSQRLPLTGFCLLWLQSSFQADELHQHLRIVCDLAVSPCSIEKLQKPQKAIRLLPHVMISTLLFHDGNLIKIETQILKVLSHLAADQAHQRRILCQPFG